VNHHTERYLTACCTASTSHFIAAKTAHNLPIVDAPADDDT
jgi:hypothetical protein